MGVFKEEAKALEDVARLQKQIWPDSCDYGVILEAPSDPREQSVRAALVGLESLPRRMTEWGNEYSGGTTYVVFIPWEREGGLYLGTEYRVTFGHGTNHGFNHLPRRFKYISIAASRATRTEEEMKS